MPSYLPCNHARLRTPHEAHDWEPQPGMDPVHCPGRADRPTPRLDVLIDRACRHLTPDEQRALRGGIAQLRKDCQLHADLVTSVERTRQMQSAAADRYEATLRADLERAREERGTYRAAWHSARDRARKHRTAVDDMWDANTRLAQRARRAEQQLADEQAEHRQAHEQETANTAAEITRAQRAEQQLAAVRSTLADRIQQAYPDDFGAGVIADHIRGLTAWPDEDAAGPADTCRPVDVDGQTIRVHGSSEMNAEDRGYFAEVVHAARRRYEAEHPDGAATPPR